MYSKEKDKITSTDKFYGNYRGRVVADDDEYRAGRVKILVFGVFDGIAIESLPWAIYADPLMGGQEELGGFFIPDVGSVVWVFFEGGDHTMPVYFAGAPARPHGPSEKSQGEYPRNKVFKIKAGHIIEIDDSDGGNRIRVHHSSGTDTEIDNAGNVTQLIVGDVTQTVEGNVDQTVKGNVDRIIEGNLKETINGNYDRNVSGSATDTISGDYAIKASRIDLN